MRRLGVPERDLADKVQEVFETFLRKEEDFDPSRPVLPWLMGIGSRIASNYRRRASYRREVMGVERETPNPGQDPEEQTSQAEARALVIQALQELPQERRLVFVLYEFEGLTVPEIVPLAGCPLNTCYSRLRKAREEFTEAIRTLTGEGGGA